MKKRPETEIQFFRTKLSPPNPILDLTKKVSEHELKLRLIEDSRNSFRSRFSNLSNPLYKTVRTVFNGSRSNSNTEKNDFEIEEGELLTHRYKNCELVYQRYDNTAHNKLRNISYLASIFIDARIFTNSKKRPEEVYCIYEKLPKGLLKARQQLLEFNSKFESGNLFAAYYMGTNEYDLILQNDVNTKGNNQWFYFSVRGGKKNQNVKFNIVNLYKSHSLYNQGMKPVVYSTINNKNKNGVGWSRYGSSIRYYCTDIEIEGHKDRYYYCLSFNYKFDFDEDLVYFCHSFPYTYSTMNQFMQSLKDKVPPEMITVKTIGTTVLNYNIPMISIGENIKEKERKFAVNTKVKYQDDKDSIIILARQHPGETQGSFVCEGFVKQLLTLDTFESKFMLSNYNFFIFPMVNIDGVINGNYRSNIMGYDLNRYWDAERLDKQPEISFIKNQITKIAKRSNVVLVLDFHGHSKKMNSFFYGNSNAKNPQIPKILPLLASKITPLVAFSSCTFNRGVDKQGAARIAIQDLLNSHKQCQVYTFQSSFYGTIRNNKKVHFSTDNYKGIGADLFTAVFKKFSENSKETKTLMESAVLKQLRKQLVNVPKNQELSGSDSEAEEIFIPIEQYIYEQTFNSNAKVIQQKAGYGYQTFVNSPQIHNQQSIFSNRMDTFNASVTYSTKQTQTYMGENDVFTINYQVQPKLNRNSLIRQQIERRKASFFLNVSQIQQLEFRAKSQDGRPLKILNQKLKVLGQQYNQQFIAQKKTAKETQTQVSFLRDHQKNLQLSVFVSNRPILTKNTPQSNKKSYLHNSFLTGRSSSSKSKQFNLDITEQVTQMIKVKKIQHKSKISNGIFKQQNQEAATKLPYV